MAGARPKGRRKPPGRCGRGAGSDAFRRVALGALVWGALVPPPAAASSSILEVPFDVPSQFGRLTLGLGGGFQFWALSSLEDSQEARARALAADGFSFSASDYNPTYSYAASLETRFARAWVTRAQIEWTRLDWDTRDRRFLAALDGSDRRTPVSVSYGTEIRTRPLLFSLGLGREVFYRSVRILISANGMVVPLAATDEALLVVGSNAVESKTEWDSSGIGPGFEGLVTVDWVPDTDMTIFIESFVRAGSVTIEPDRDADESSFLPSRREVGLGGFGVRVGFRWI